MSETEPRCETELYFQRLKAEREKIVSSDNSRADLGSNSTNELVSRYIELMAKTDKSSDFIEQSGVNRLPNDVHGLWLINAEARYFCMVLKDYDRSTDRICSLINVVRERFPNGITSGEPESNSFLPVLLLNLARIQREAGDLASAKTRSLQLKSFIEDSSRRFNLAAFPTDISSKAQEIAEWCNRNLSDSSRRFIIRKLVRFHQSLMQRQHE